MNIINTNELLILQISKDNDRFSKFDSEVTEKSTEVKESKNPNEALRYAMQLSYILLSYRSVLIEVLNNLRLSYPSFPETQKARLKSHEKQITDRLDNLKDLHSSVELIQRISYANRIQ